MDYVVIVTSLVIGVVGMYRVLTEKETPDADVQLAMDLLGKRKFD